MTQQQLNPNGALIMQALLQKNNPGFKYVPSHETDIRETFIRARDEMAHGTKWRAVK